MATEILALKPCPGYSSGQTRAAKPRGCRLGRLRAAIPVAMIFAALLAVPAAFAVEAVSVRIDAPAIDLTEVVERQKTETDRVQVSTAPGPDGIVRRVEV